MSRGVRIQNMEQKRPYRVLIIHNYYQIPGGEDTVVNNEKRLLKEHGHAVFFYMRENREINEFSLLQKLCLPFQTIFSPRTYHEIKRIIREKRIDLIHVHNTLSLISPSVYYAAFHCKVPVIQTVHNFRLLCPGAVFVRKGSICEACVEKGLVCSLKGKCYRDSLLQTLVSALTLKLHRIAGTYGKIYYICLTEFNKKKLLLLNNRGKLLIEPDHVFVKPNFVWSASEVLPTAKRKNQFLYVGRIDALKGIEVLLEAWKGIKESQLVICGTGPKEFHVVEFLKQNKLDNVLLLGQVNHERVLELLRESRALIMPTQWYEGQPMVILESYSAGTPIIGSRLGNVQDMIVEKVTGYTFSHNKPEELQNIIKSFPVLDAAVIRRHFDEKYGREQNYERLMDIYERSIGNLWGQK